MDSFLNDVDKKIAQAKSDMLKPATRKQLMELERDLIFLEELKKDYLSKNKDSLLYKINKDNKKNKK